MYQSRPSFLKKFYNPKLHEKYLISEVYLNCAPVHSWKLDISRQGPQIVWRAQLGKDPTKTHRNIQIFYPFHKDFLCHKLTNYFWQLTYVVDKSNAKPLKRSANREACIEQTAANEETLEVEYLTRQLWAFYRFWITMKLTVLNWWPYFLKIFFTWPLLPGRVYKRKFCLSGCLSVCHWHQKEPWCLAKVVNKVVAVAMQTNFGALGSHTVLEQPSDLW